MTAQRKMDDIVLPQRKIDALRHIMRKDKEEDFPPQDKNKRIVPTKKRYQSFILWILVLVALLFLIFSLSTIFEKATFTIVPKEKITELDDVFTATRTANSPNAILFQVMTLEDTKKIVIPATDVKQVERKASGTIIIYNNFNAQPQRLIKNTRFETTNGLVFRIRESITVPGVKGSAPGSIEAAIYADGVGKEYNVGLVDFTIPGFKGTPRYEKFYARSKTPMTGGFTGVVKTVSETELARVRSELQNNLKTELLLKARAQKPENSILYDAGVFLSYEDGSDTIEEAGAEKDTFEFSQKGTLHAILFDRSLLTAALIKRLVGEAGKTDVIEVKNLNELSFTINQKEQLAPLDLKSISFTLKGAPQFIWTTDFVKLAEALTGMQKTQIKTILSEFPSIAKAEVVVRPFWKKTFPENPKDIVIISTLKE